MGSFFGLAHCWSAKTFSLAERSLLGHFVIEVPFRRGNSLAGRQNRSVLFGAVSGSRSGLRTPDHFTDGLNDQRRLSRLDEMAALLGHLESTFGGALREILLEFPPGALEGNELSFSNPLRPVSRLNAAA
jgi:hypothetical protein